VGSGFSKMKKQARLMEQQIEQMKQSMQSTVVTGSSGAGLVSVTLNGEKQLQSIKIKPECVSKDDVEGLEDLIIAAFQDAQAKLDEQNGGSLPGGMSLPF
jgi:DNA-binding YbaB/EbfC family protein